MPEHKQIALHNLDSLEASECCGEKHDVLVESVLAANYRVSEQGLLNGERKERDEWKERDLRRLERKCMKEDDSEVKSRFGREEGGREQCGCNPGHLFPLATPTFFLLGLLCASN